jgi:hypothetical protein
VEDVTERRLLDCEEIAARFSVESGHLAGLLPGGFHFPASDPSADVAGPRQAAELLVSVVRADDVGATGDTTFGSTVASVMLRVVPPAALALLGAEYHAVRLFEFGDGMVSLRTQRQGGGTRFSVRAHRSPASLTLSGQVPDGSWLPAPAAHSRIFITTEGEVAAAGDLETSLAGESTPGPARMRVEGLPALPTALDGTAIHKSGFDCTSRPVAVPRAPVS